jgi:hypothetical protein
MRKVPSGRGFTKNLYRDNNKRATDCPQSAASWAERTEARSDVGDGVTGKSGNPARGALGAIFLACMAATALSGCGVSTLTSTFSGTTGGIFGGGGGNKAPEPAQQKVSEGNLLTAAQNDAGGQTDITGKDPDCPTVSIAPGDGSITFSAKGGNNDGLSVMHRGEITKTARECAIGINGGLDVRFGFAGRVLLGPQGKAGTVTLPIKVTILDASRATVRSDLVKVPVTITPDQTAGYFSITREVQVPLPPGASAKAYRILIAFDRKAPGAS